jgi:hypothetical protein
VPQGKGLYTLRDAFSICNSLWVTLIPYNRESEQLVGSLSFKKFFALSWNRRFIALFTKNLPPFPVLGQMRTFRAVPYYLFHIRFCIITKLQLGIHCVPFPSIFPTQAYVHFCDSSYLPHDPHILSDTSTFRGRASGTYTLPTAITCVQCLGAQIGSNFCTATLQISY